MRALVRVPNGYASPEEFADDCGFELVASGRGFNADEFSYLASRIRHYVAMKDEKSLAAVMSNNFNVILASLDIVGDKDKASIADENAGQIGPGKSVESIREKSDTEAGADLPAGRQAMGGLVIWPIAQAPRDGTLIYAYDGDWWRPVRWDAKTGKWLMQGHFIVNPTVWCPVDFGYEELLAQVAMGYQPWHL